MKKSVSDCLQRHGCITVAKMLLVMQLCFFCQLLSAQRMLEKTVTVDLHQVPLGDALNKISRLSGVKIAYVQSMITQAKAVSYHCQEEKLSHVLEEVLRPRGLSYTLVGNIVVVKEAETFRPYQHNRTTDTATAHLGVVRGWITGVNGTAIPGATIRVQGKTGVAITGEEGHFELHGAGTGDSLEITGAGFISRTVAVTGEKELLIQMEEQVPGLSDVVVVGYGTQKKKNLTGSVTVIDGQALTLRPVGQGSAALQGLAAGVTVIQRSGEPGVDVGSIRIRGVGTFSSAGADPYVLVDGVDGSINSIDPNLIESVTILKDAAAASIYGSRGANGVILITTRRAKASRLSIAYSGYTGWQKPTNLPKVVNALDHMLLTNEANTNVGNSAPYSEALIQKYRAQGNGSSDSLPNTDWQKATLTASGFQQSHFVTVNGGSEKIRMLASMGYFDQAGLIPHSSFRRFTIRNNADIIFSSKFNMRIDLQYVNQIATAPSAGAATIFHWINNLPANQLARNANGTYGVGWNGINPVAASISGGTSVTKTPFGSINTTLNYQPLSWLKAEMTIAPKYAENLGKTFSKAVQSYYPDGRPAYLTPAKTQLIQSSAQSRYNYWRGTLTASRSFSRHDLKLMAGAEQQDYHTENIAASRDTYVLTDYPVLNAGSPFSQTNSGTGEETALRSFFGRLNYGFGNKYLLELNARYDGSSRFSQGHKWGFFPSFSAGWRVSQEAFMQSLKPVINELKLRASWGRLGNQNISSYPSVASLSYGAYTIGGQIVNTAAINSLANSNITWEKTAMTNAGADMTLFRHLTITADYYYRKTTDILLNLNVPLIIGLAAPVQNAGIVTNRGWELTIGYKGKSGDFTYDINANFSDVVNKVVDMHGIRQTGITINREGYPIGAIYGYEAEGFFNSEDEITKHAKQFGQLAPGDIKYKDQNGDGIINEADKKVLGSTIPRYTYGVTLHGAYRGLELSVLLQGVGKADGLLYGGAVMPFYVDDIGGSLLEINKDRWTPQHTNASFPRLAWGGSNNQQVSSFWMRDAAYLRIKNIQLGYTLPAAFTARLGVQSLRVYANLSNAFSFDHFWKGYDVESPVGKGNVYPQVKVYSFGIHVNF